MLLGKISCSINTPRISNSIDEIDKFHAVTFDMMSYLFSFSVCDKSNNLYAEYLFHKTFRRDRDDLQSYSDYQNNKYIQMQQTPLVQR